MPLTRTLRPFPSQEAKVSRNGQVQHDGFEFLHAPGMYDLSTAGWPGKKAFVAATVFGITGR